MGKNASLGLLVPLVAGTTARTWASEAWSTLPLKFILGTTRGFESGQPWSLRIRCPQATLVNNVSSLNFGA